LGAWRLAVLAALDVAADEGGDREVLRTDLRAPRPDLDW
jgi:hypothetical protein